jgi:activator of HSP90 ATPase
MLECYFALGWKDLPGTNSLAYWAHSYFRKKLKSCEYDSNVAKLEIVVQIEKKIQKYLNLSTPIFPPK